MAPPLALLYLACQELFAGASVGQAVAEVSAANFLSGTSLTTSLRRSALLSPCALPMYVARNLHLLCFVNVEGHEEATSE